MQDLSGDRVRGAFAAATQCLERYREAINALNVFPVPDGDTGTNMLLTMRSAMEKCPQGAGITVADAVAGLAAGAFWGARGNSGVILSQFLRGFADALQGKQDCDAAGLARSLRLATDAAYRSVGQPVEGTMLTVIRSASASVQEELGRPEQTDALSLWTAAFEAATEALYRTPSQLPVLDEAGVVDAGGLGIVAIMGGGLCHLLGQDWDLVDRAVAAACIEPALAASGAGIEGDYLHSTLDARWGYCIQFLIEGQGLHLDEMRSRLGAGVADSAVVVGDDRYARVHVHAADPGPALSYGVSLGELHQVRVENIQQQNLEFVTGRRFREPVAARVAVVAVAQGEGLARLFREAGCAAIVNGGQTMNPSVGEILAAADSSGAVETIVLPNNANVVATAEQSAAANPSLHVVPSRTLPQGVAAVLAFNPEEPLEHNLRAMGKALENVITIEVTKAVRRATIGGRAVDAGQYMGLLEGEMASRDDTPEAALKAALDRVVRSPDQIVTLYRGADAEPDAAQELRRRLQEETPGIQVDLVHGGQPHYHYLASVE